MQMAGPLRTIVDGRGYDGELRYFYKSLKWLTEIRLISDNLEKSRLGTWEQYAGYSMSGKRSDEKIVPFLAWMNHENIPVWTSNSVAVSSFHQALMSGDLSKLVSGQLHKVVAEFASHPLWTSDLTFQSKCDRASDSSGKSGELIQASAFRLTNFAELDLRRFDFSQVNFSLSRFQRCRMGSVIASDAAIMKETDCEGANFRDADLRHVDFRSAWLTKANFENAQLDGANFQYANLREVNLNPVATATGTDFFGARGIDFLSAKRLKALGALNVKSNSLR